MKIFQSGIKLLTSQIARDLSLVSTGNIFATGLGFLSVLVISRDLSVSDFGLFNIAVSVILMVPPLIDFGINAGMIKFASTYLGMGKITEASEVFRTTLIVKTATSLVFTLILFNGASLVSLKIFNYPDLVPLIQLSAIGVFSVSLFNYLKSALFTYKLFKECVFIQILVDLIKLLSVIVLILTLSLSTFNAVAVFAFIPFVGVLASFKHTSRYLFIKGKPEKNLFQQLFSFSKWKFISNICTAVFPYIGIFMVAKILDSTASGVYGLAMNLTYIFPIFIYSLSSVLLPEVSRFREIKQYENYLKGSLKVSLFIGLAIMPFLLFSREIIIFIFGSRYLGSVVVFNWFLLSYIVLLIMINVRIALLSMNLPHVTAISDLVKVIVMVFGCYLVVPRLGVQAPAILSFILNISILGVLSVYVFKKIRSGKIIIHD